MKLGRLPRGLGAMLVASALVVLAPSPASAAPAAPAAYTVLARAYPLFWAGSSGLPVDSLRVPYVSGVTNNLPITEARAALAQPDLSVTAMRSEQIEGLTCAGFEESKCGDPFVPVAEVNHPNLSVEPAHRDQAASFAGKEGKHPGSIHALTDCAADCGNQLVRTMGEAAGPAGGLGGYITIGGSSASHDTSIDSAGRLTGLARSELRDAVIGPRHEITFTSLSTTATASGLGAVNSKDGRGDVRVENLLILDQPVELTSAGLRLANATSEQEAYDGAKALLEELKKRGITLEVPDFAAQVDRQPDFVTVKVKGFTVRFDQSVQGPPGVPSQTVSQALDLGSSTALVAAFDREREITINDGDKVQASPELPAPAPGPSPAGPNGPDKGNVSKPVKTPTQRPAPLPNNNGDFEVSAPAPPAPAPEQGEVNGPAVPPSTDPAFGPDKTALDVDDVVDTLGLRGARSVSRAFGAFLGLGLIIPVARFVIRRLG